MAHSRIIQLETEPIADIGQTTADGIIWRDYDKWFLGSVADWVNDDKYQNETINNFIEYMKSFGPYVETFYEEDEQ